MPISLAGKVVVVIGASSGVGRAAAVQFAAEGAKVMAAARRKDRLEELATEVRGNGGTIEIMEMDAADRGQAESLMSAAKQKFGALDIVVYSTGTNIPGRAVKVLTASDWDLLISVNLTGAFHCTQAALPTMREAGGGLIVYVSSISAHIVDVSGVAYQASKRGMVGLAHGTRHEERGNGIRTSVIFPGLIDTELLSKRPAPTPAEQVAAALQPEDVADAILAVARMHPRVAIPEMEIVPSKFQ